MKKGLRKTLLYISILAAVVATCAPILYRVLSKEEPEQSLNLPDGTTLTLKKAAFGNGHQLSYGKIDPSVRHQYQNRYDTNTPLRLWFYQTARSDNQRPEDLFFRISDETGLVHLPQATEYYTQLHTNWYGDRIAHAMFFAFPHHATNLTIYVHALDNRWQRVVAGSFQIKNHARGPFPIWQPEPLPATRKDGNLELTLTSLKVKTGAKEKQTVSSVPGTEVMFQVRSGGQVAPAWHVESLQLSDATGNTLFFREGDRHVMVDGSGLFWVSNCWLELTEPAWKLHAEFSHQADYSPEELVTIRNIPTSGGIPENARRGSFKGASLYIQEIAHENIMGANTYVEVSVQPKTERFRVTLLKATNERGQEIAIPHPSCSDSKYSTHRFSLHIPENTKLLNLTFAYQESRFADYTVRPEVVSLED